MKCILYYMTYLYRQMIVLVLLPILCSCVAFIGSSMIGVNLLIVLMYT